MNLRKENMNVFSDFNDVVEENLINSINGAKTKDFWRDILIGVVVLFFGMPSLTKY